MAQESRKIEWELTLDCNFSCSYCSNGRNQVLKTPVVAETDESKLYEFIKSLPSDIEIFCFGGEPTLHPKFDYIIQTLNELNKLYVLQTNLSTNKNLSNVKALQVSIHPQSKHTEILKRCIRYKPRRVDIMCINAENSVELYNYYGKFLKNVYIAPIADFNTGNQEHLGCLKEFIKLKQQMPQICEPGDRAYKWLSMQTGESLTYNKPCIYKGVYTLYAPDLRAYNCSHRINCDVCPNKHCFLM